MLASTIPSWKEEILQRKRAEKMKEEPIPLWKRELLKRLHSKAELAKHKLAEDKVKEEKLVSDEHILKVSENVFVRQEIHRKMSSGHVISTSAPHDDDVTTTGYGIRKDILIIEHDSATNLKEVKGRNLSNREMFEVELPSAGIVSRLKGKFAPKGKATFPADDPSLRSTVESIPTPRSRSKSSDLLQDKALPDKDVETPPTSPIRSRNPPSSQSDPARARLPSVELAAPRGFHSHTQTTNVTPEPFHKVKEPPLIRKFSAPMLPVNRTRVPSKEESVDMTSLHSSGSPEHRNVSSCKSASSQQYKEQSKEFPKDIASLHSSGTENEETEKEDDFELDIQPETLTISTVGLIKPKVTAVHNKPAESKQETADAKQRLVDLRKTSSVEHITESRKAPVSKPQSPTKPSYLGKLRGSTKPPSNPPVSSNKENIPEIPKRLTSSVTNNKAEANLPKAADTSLSPIKVQNHENVVQTDQCKIIDLGRTSMDPSLLKSKAAIAANEIMKESKTMLIVPKRKQNGIITPVGTVKAYDKSQNITSTKISPPLSQNNAVKTASKPIETQRTVASRDTSVTNGEKTQNPPAPVSNDTLPSSSVDDVIIPSPVDELKPVMFQEQVILNSVKKEEKKITANENKTLVNDKKSEKSATVNKPANNVRNFVVNSGNRSVVTNRSSESNEAIKSLFGSKLSGSAAKSTPSFGGKSFMIDPSKFKRSNAPSAAKSTTVKKAPIATSNNTMVITPKTNVDSVDVAVNKTEVTSAPKGKRKLTVDQITVIGGYVKLDHSTLSKPNKMRKGAHVKFNASRLESVYQYPSESSLLHEEQESKLNTQMSKLGGGSTTLKESQVGKYTPKYLLAMKESIPDDEDDVKDSSITSKTENKKPETASTDPTPLKEENATSFSLSSSNDLLF